MTATEAPAQPLTTIFTPPPACFESTRTVNGSYFLGPTETSKCMPSGWKPTSWFSPGVCPSGYEIATRTPYLHGTVTESQGVCCPSGFFMASLDFDSSTITPCPCVTDLAEARTLTASPISIRWHEYIPPDPSSPTKNTNSLGPICVGVSVFTFLTIISIVILNYVLPRLHNLSQTGTRNTDHKSKEQEEKAPGHETIPYGRSWKRWDLMTVDSWSYEILATYLSVICLMAIFLVLWTYDQQPTPKFAYGLTLNTIISLLSAATKSPGIFAVGECIGQLRWIRFKKTSNPMSQIQAYDDASRGPWGSLLILLHDKGQSLITVGALITMLSLIFDPFVQQVITYPVREIAVPSSHARVKQSRSFSADDNYYALSAAANTAIWATEQGLDPVCPSGSCSWPAFESVELCSRCEDVTSSAEIVGCDSLSFDSSIGRDQLISCNVSLPYGAWSSFPVSITSNWGSADDSGDHHSASSETNATFTMAVPRILVWMADGRFESYPSAKSSRFPESTFLGATNPLYVLAYADLGVTGEATTVSNPTDGLQLVNVTQCAISFCLKTYEVSVVSGVTSTKVKNEDFGAYYMANISGQDNPSTCWKPNRPIDEASSPQAEAKTLSHDRLVATNSTGFGFCELGSGLDLENYPNLQGEFQELYRWEHSPSLNESSWFGPYNTAGGNRDVLFWIHRVGFETVMDRVATSLSKFARDNSDYTVSGEMAVSESFVNVEWPWTILPASLVVSTICLLISTIIMTSHRRVSLWKTSILPLLFNGPGSDLATAHGGTLSSLSEMERHSKTIQLKLAASNTEGRLVLRQQD